MVLKRKLDEGDEESAEVPTSESKHGHFRRISVSRDVDEEKAQLKLVLRLEPMIRDWVREEVEKVISRHMRSSDEQAECSGSRILQLCFDNSLPKTLYTGNNILSEDNAHIKISLHDSSSNNIISSGPLSKAKADIVVVDGDFGADDQEHWTEKHFNGKIVRNREGKRPLLTGELTVQLHDGVGFVGEASFTDNSSWIKCGKFRLGAKLNAGIRVREGISTAFKVKDHRGESYQKHHPPSLDDEVWRLEGIAKDGAPHRRLSGQGIHCLRDFLRLYVTDQSSLRNLLTNVTIKKWEKIIGHAAEYVSDNKTYAYITAQGTGLLLNSIYEVVGATFDGENYHSLEQLDMYQKLVVQDLKRNAYKNLTDLVPVSNQSIVGNPMLLLANGIGDSVSNPCLTEQDANFPIVTDQLDMQMISDNPYKCNALKEKDFFEVSFGESSHQMQGANSSPPNTFGVSDSHSGLYTGDRGWGFGESYVDSHLLAEDPAAGDCFGVETSGWQRNQVFAMPSNHEAGTLSSSSSSYSGICIPRNGKKKRRWSIVRAVFKWWILVRQDLAARKWTFYNYV